MNREDPDRERVRRLPNNAYLVSTRAGDVLVNCPPETLKTLLALGHDLPAQIVLPVDIPAGQEIGSSGFVHRGINYASVEFLLDARFFFHGQQTTIVTPTADQARRLRQILDETIVGPQESSEYAGFRWLEQECINTSYFPSLDRAPTTDDLAHFIALDQEPGYLGHGVRVALDHGRAHFLFYEEGRVVARVPTALNRPVQPLRLTPARPLLRHELTLQFIGGSDGFDPRGITTCFIAYLRSDARYKATLFDAAAYLRQRLSSIGISPRQISEVVLSHLHEDHLAGLPELLLLGERRVRLLTSDIIYRSLIRVLSAMFNLPPQEVTALFDYVPLNPGEPVLLEGRRFEAIYAVHTIPTIAVRANDLYYSGDMRYDETWFDELAADGVLSQERKAQLTSFAEGAKVIVQDAGGGAVHTSITREVLETLAAKGQRIILAHTRAQQLPTDNQAIIEQVEFASSGHISNIGAPMDAADPVDARLETVSASPLLARLSYERRAALARAAQIFEWDDGEIIVHEGRPSDDWLYLVHAGIVQLEGGGGARRTIGRGSSFGERGVLRGSRRQATATARGWVQLLGLRKDIFQPVARDLGLHTATDRADWLSEHAGSLFKDWLWVSLLDLALEFQPRHFAAGEKLFERGDKGLESFLLVSGAVAVVDGEGYVIDIMENSGTFFGSRAPLFNTPRNAAAVATRAAEVWALPAPALQRLHMVYPNLLLHMRVIEGPRRGERPPGVKNRLPFTGS